MQIRKILTVAAVSAGLIAGNLTALTTSASAEGWRNHDGYSERHRGPRHWDRSDFHDDYGHRRHHRRHRGGAVALGVGALLLGAIIASEANRGHRNGYRTYDHYND